MKEDIYSVNHYEDRLRKQIQQPACGKEYLMSYCFGVIQTLAEDGNNKAILNVIKAYDNVIHGK